VSNAFGRHLGAFAEAYFNGIQHIFRDLWRQYPEIIGQHNENGSENQHPLVPPKIFIK
jgi:hypothetical protein